MIITNIGYNQYHGADFQIDRPEGSNDYLMLLLKTEAVFVFDGQPVSTRPDTILFYRKGRPQLYSSQPQHPFINDWVHFHFEEGEEEHFLSLGLEYEKPYRLDNAYFASYLIKSISSEFYSEHRYAQSNINHYAGLLLNYVSEQAASTYQQPRTSMYEMLSSVRNRLYSGNYQFTSVESSAHEIGMSKSHFQHLYKQYFGVSFKQDLINSRVEHSKTLLLTTNLSSIDVAKQCGYTSLAHYFRQFKAQTGQTPLEFRKSQGKEQT